MIKIGPYQINGRAVLAPMAGVTDFPFRKACLANGASLVTSEMCASNPALQRSLKSRTRTADPEDAEPRIVQIVGSDPMQMAYAAAYQVDRGAQIIDINMGCPAKKVCKKLAGSALLKDEKLVADILTAVVNQVDVPVTLKIRTGWNTVNRNAVQIAQMAESIGIQSLAVHGRTRECRFNGSAEYDTIALVAQAVSIPVFANGDIQSAQKAHDILNYTGASGIMIGRAAQGNPWIFHEINNLLSKSNLSSELFTAKSLTFGNAKLKRGHIIDHLNEIYRYYGQFQRELDTIQAMKPRIDLAVKIARKHISWYFDHFAQIISANCCNNSLESSSLLMNVVGSRRGVSKAKELRNSTDCQNTRESDELRYAELCVEMDIQLRNIKIAKKQFNQLDSQFAQLEYIENFLGTNKPQGTSQHEHKRLLFA
jgi:tRNA-dihydrouridine synthase B